MLVVKGWEMAVSAEGRGVWGPEEAEARKEVARRLGTWRGINGAGVMEHVGRWELQAEGVGGTMGR